MSFLSELQRRRVFRVAAVYAVAAWAIIQVSDTVLPRLGLPDWSVTLVIALVALGAPIALILAWAFDVGPDGIKRDTTPVAVPRSSTAGRIAVVAAIVILAGAGLAFLSRGRREELDSRRVAVAAFVNRTGDASLNAVGRLAAEYIIRGLTESGEVDVAGTPAELDPKYLDNPLETQIRILAHSASAGTVVTGSLYREGDSVLIVAQVSDARRAKLQRTIGPVSFSQGGTTTAAAERMREYVTGGVLALVTPAGYGGVPFGLGIHNDYMLRNLRGYKPFEDLLKPKG